MDADRQRALLPWCEPQIRIDDFDPSSLRGRRKRPAAPQLVDLSARPNRNRIEVQVNRLNRGRIQDGVESRTVINGDFGWLAGGVCLRQVIKIRWPTSRSYQTRAIPLILINLFLPVSDGVDQAVQVVYRSLEKCRRPQSGCGRVCFTGEPEQSWVISDQPEREIWRPRNLIKPVPAVGEHPTSWDVGLQQVAARNHRRKLIDEPWAGDLIAMNYKDPIAAALGVCPRGETLPRHGKLVTQQTIGDRRVASNIIRICLNVREHHDLISNAAQSVKKRDDAFAWIPRWT